MYVQDSLEAEARVFLDPNKLSDDGTTSLRGTAFSENGEIYAYGLSERGSDWVTIKVSEIVSFILYFTVKTNVYQNLIKLVFSLI